MRERKNLVRRYVGRKVPKELHDWRLIRQREILSSFFTAFFFGTDRARAASKPPSRQKNSRPSDRRPWTDYAERGLGGTTETVGIRIAR
jgi:hypothetical protein